MLLRPFQAVADARARNRRIRAAETCEAKGAGVRVEPGSLHFPLEGVAYHSPERVMRHRRTGAWMWTTIGDQLRNTARLAGARVFIVTEEAPLTYGDVDQASEAAAAGLLDIGLRPGDRAIFQAGPVKELVIALFGCFKCGVIPVCTLPQYREYEIGQLIRLSGARAYFVQSDFSPGFSQADFARDMVRKNPVIEKVIVMRGPTRDGEFSLEDLSTRFSTPVSRMRTRAADPGPCDVALFQLSGGSTGMPKIIPRMHAEYLGASLAWKARHRLQERDVSLWALPLIHNAGMVLMMFPTLLAGGTLVLQKRFDPVAFLTAIQIRKVTYTGSIGPIAASIINCSDISQFDLSSLRMMFTLTYADGLEESTGIPSQLTYGITEGMLMASSPNAPAEIRHRTIGWPIGVGDETKLLEPSRERTVQPGQVGEFCFRGPHTFNGYYDAPSLTAESFTSDGFFRSSDLMQEVLVEGRPHYVFEGRLRDNINRGGEKFGAEEVESFLRRHPAVNDVRVVSMPDPMLGERACAFLIIRPGHSAPTVAALGGFLQARGLAKFKTPERVEVIDEFPLTSVGKIDKQALRSRIQDILADEKKAQSWPA